MKKFLVGLLLICFGVNLSASTPGVKYFYTTYMRNILEGKDNSALCEAYLSKGLIEKLDRVGKATNMDQIIRAQDVSTDAIETLRVKELGNDWYMVTYSWYKEKPDWYSGDNEPICIPLKAISKDGKCQIIYITPSWNRTMFGDHLLYSGQNLDFPIDYSSGQNFVKSFYNKYLSIYYSMGENIESDLFSLRSRHLTQNAQSQFKKQENIWLWDTYSGYDLLIDNFDFDYIWKNSIEIIQTGDDLYEFSYILGATDYKTTISLSLSLIDGNYKIDSITKK